MKYFEQKTLLKLKPLFYLSIFLILLNLISKDYFFRIDLTSEKIHSPDSSTVTYLKNLDRKVYLKIYLEGDLPLNFKRLRRRIIDFLDEIILINDNIEFELIDIEKLTENERISFYELLRKNGLFPTTVFRDEGGNRTERLVYPICIATQGEEASIFNLLSGEQASIQSKINHSIINIEPILMREIKAISAKKNKKIAILRGHRETPKRNLQGLLSEINKFYTSSYISLDETTNLNQYDCIIISGPKMPFDDKDKYIIDQYIVNGGRCLLLLDMIKVSYENLIKGLDFSLPNNLNLDDMIFNWGIRINEDLIQDANCTYHTMSVGYTGDTPQIEWIRWPFFPIITNFGKSIITRNVKAVSTRFCSTIDVIEKPHITKKPLLFTSPNTIISHSPVRIYLNNLRNGIDPSVFKQGKRAIGYLLEGKFTSLYKNRYVPEGFDDKKTKEEYLESKIIIYTTSSIITNDYDPESKNHLPWGLDYYYKTIFDQGTLIFNSIAYLTDCPELITPRKDTSKIRLLNSTRVKKYFRRIQVINLILPLLLLIVWGIFWKVRHIYFCRKKYYNKP